MDVRTAAKLIRRGEIVAFPTETIYGLGANALDPTAVQKIFTAKGRPADNPLIVHVSDQEMLEQLVLRIPPVAKRLMQRFWPGPLTIIFEKRRIVPDITTAGRSDVAVRMPNHLIALNLISRSGVPIAAPSANKSGRPSPTSAAHVREDFPELPILDDGETRHGLESTVISVVGKPTILRLGALSIEEIRKVVPKVQLNTKLKKRAAPASPGQKYTHYAPSVPLHLFKDPAALQRFARTQNATILCRAQDAAKFRGNIISLGRKNEDIAHNLYAALRATKNGVLLVLAVPKRGLGRTIMDRLERAATTIH